METQLAPEVWDFLHAHDAELYVWTVDDPARLLTLDALGVTGVITNDRELFRRAGLDAAPA